MAKSEFGTQIFADVCRFVQFFNANMHPNQCSGRFRQTAERYDRSMLQDDTTPTLYTRIPCMYVGRGMDNAGPLSKKRRARG